MGRFGKKDDQQAVKILKIDKLLRSQRWKMKELAHRFDVSERTMRRYFKYFESADIEIEKDFDNRYFIPTYE